MFQDDLCVKKNKNKNKWITNKNPDYKLENSVNVCIVVVAYLIESSIYLKTLDILATS